MSNGWRLTAACLGIVLVAYFIWFAAQALNIGLLRQVWLSPRVVLGVLVAALLYALIIPVTAWAWRRLLDAQGESWAIWPLARCMALAQLAKYVPGNVAQHAARAGLALRAGMSTRAFFATVGQETLLAVGASVLVGFSMLAFSESEAVLGQLTPTVLRGLVMLAVGLALGILLVASVKAPPRALMEHRSKWFRLLGRLGGLPGASVALPALAGYVLNYFMIGFGLWLVARAADLPAAMNFSLLTAVFALSWILGFLAPGAPAGLGAREAIMLLLLHGSASADMLLTFVLLARVVTMLGDGMCFGIASLWRAPEPLRRGDPS